MIENLRVIYLDKSTEISQDHSECIYGCIYGELDGKPCVFAICDTVVEVASHWFGLYGGTIMEDVQEDARQQILKFAWSEMKDGKPMDKIENLQVVHLDMDVKLGQRISENAYGCVTGEAYGKFYTFLISGSKVRIVGYRTGQDSQITIEEIPKDMVEQILSFVWKEMIK